MSTRTPLAPGQAQVPGTAPHRVLGYAVAEGAAPLLQAILAQTRAELAMTLRRGESLLVTLVMPILFLIFFTRFVPLTSVGSSPIAFLLPGVLVVAVMSTGMVSLGIATAYERYYGVLKRLGSSPLPRVGLLAAKLLSVLALEIVQIALLVLLALVFLGWHPAGPLWAALPIVLLGTAVFSGFGMLMAGALRAEATLAGANGLYVVFLAIGGVFVPVGKFGPVAGLVGLLPPAAFSNALRGAMTPQGVPLGSVVILFVWAVVIITAAARTFKWE